jgi:hypothetical protein
MLTKLTPLMFFYISSGAALHMATDLWKQRKGKIFIGHRLMILLTYSLFFSDIIICFIQKYFLHTRKKHKMDTKNQN